MRRRVGYVLLLGLIGCGGPSPPLGPVDGRGLPPNDLDQVGVGDPAPDFTLEDAHGRHTTLSAFRGRREVVLVFYRGHW